MMRGGRGPHANNNHEDATRALPAGVRVDSRADQHQLAWIARQGRADPAGGV